MRWMRSTAFLLCAALLPVVAFAQEIPFKIHNPDIEKYDFARSFITGLGYYSRVALRLAAEDAAKDATPDLKYIQTLIDDRTLDNTEIRIARNYLTKYTTAQNGLIRRIAIDTAAAYDAVLDISSRERRLWQTFQRYRTSNEPEDFDENAFGQQQLALAYEKKEAAKGLVKASMLLTKVFLSAARCDSDNCTYLALTQDERYKLVEKLDDFGRETSVWGAKPGQSTLEACIATIREVLEDPLYLSLTQ